MNNRALRMALPSVLALCLLAGCNNEASQRRAFIAFLQNRILNQTGLRVPHPTADERSGFGDYAKQYAIITDFNDALSARVSAPMQQAASRGNITSLADLMARQADLASIRQGLDSIGAELNRQIATADAAHAALAQPADLKPVYDAAYERDVTAPATAFRQAVPATQAALAAAADVAGFITQHHDTITVQGSTVQASDSTIQAQLNEKLATLNTREQAAQSAYQALQALVAGN